VCYTFLQTVSPKEHVMDLPQRRQILSVIDTLSSRYLQGKVRALKLSMVALLSGGHLLLEDIPGLGKTTLALALSGALGLSFGRIQSTSDLLPSDITGLSIFNREENSFRFVPGPIFNHIVLMDEINRAMPRTQSALLEAMEERRVTVEGVTYPLPEPFLVIATQNPVEQVGTFPLPESQMDRFLIRTGIGYPPPQIEKHIFQGGSVRDEVKSLAPLMEHDAIMEAIRFVRQGVCLSERVTGYLYDIVAATRSHPALLTGISTRGGISLGEASRAVAYLEGRDFVAPEDVRWVATAVCSHRLIPGIDQEAVDKEALFAAILNEIPLPLV
jgi:MoxR-like ATPase